MRSSSASTALLLVFLIVPATAASRDCDPAPDADKLPSLVESRDSVGLAQHLFKTAGLSQDFKSAHGVDGVKNAIDGLVNKSLEGRTENDAQPATDEAARLAAQFREGIVAACDEIKEGKSDEQARRKAIFAANLSGGDSQFVVLLGTVNSLEADGNFSAGLEASFQSTTDFRATDLPAIGRLYSADSERVIKGTFEITFSEIGSIDDESEGMSGTQEPNQNPFEAGGGFFRLNTSADFYFSEGAAAGLGVRVGGGFSTQPSDGADDNVDTRGRGYGGLVFRANYGADENGRQGKGEVFLGYAKDKFWKFERVIDNSVIPTVTEPINETGRLVVDARMDVPQVFQSEDVRLHARLFADLPASGDGPSDIRISLLLTVNLGAFFPLN